MKKKVIIGLSGGVDSSVAAFFLLQQKYDVEGVFMRNWDSSVNYDIEGNPYLQDDICPQEKDFQDALKIAQKLNIPCHKVDFSEDYWNQVFTSFLDDFKKNLTPNPDVLCNNKIKFLAFIKYANQYFKTDYIAMGHYAKIVTQNNQSILAKATDLNKDQSYFLSQLKQEQLTNILFPLSNITKKEVREIAQRENFITAHKKDSTGICFIGERNFFNFLNNYLPNKPGLIKDMNGFVFQEKHEGVIKYTIGQRKNLNMKVTKNNQAPWYVVGKDLKTNTLYVDQSYDSPYLYSDSAIIQDVVWRNEGIFSRNQTKIMTAKFRYRQPDQKINMEWLNKNTVKVFYPQKIKSVTPGQVCAFYYNDFCLGGGIISEVYFKNKKLPYI